jgi:hypothetical protein
MPSAPTRTITAILTTAVASLMLVLPAAAGAATSKYPPSSAARGFVGGAAGWTSSSSNEGTCLPPVLCASVTNSYQGSGGTDGGGFIRSSYLGVAGATAVGGTTSGTWESPAFTYEGAGGETASAVGFSLDRRSNVDQLLGLAGNSAEYTVRLLDLSEGGEATTLIAPATLAGADSWTGVSRGSISPQSLTPGHSYRIQITSTYTTGTAVVASGNADYDNVVLTASDGGSTGKGSGGGKGKGQGKGGNGSGALTEQRLLELLRQATPGSAVVTEGGKRLLVRVNCPRKIGHACRTTAQGLLNKHRPATLKQTVRLRRGKSKLVALRVKPAVRQRLNARKRLLVRQKVHAGKTVATVYRSRKLVRR